VVDEEGPTKTIKGGHFLSLHPLHLLLGPLGPIYVGILGILAKKLATAFLEPFLALLLVLMLDICVFSLLGSYLWGVAFFTPIMVIVAWVVIIGSVVKRSCTNPRVFPHRTLAMLLWGPLVCFDWSERLS